MGSTLRGSVGSCCGGHESEGSWIAYGNPNHLQASIQQCLPITSWRMFAPEPIFGMPSSSFQATTADAVMQERR
jgi:hypothetical protein